MTSRCVFRCDLGFALCDPVPSTPEIDEMRVDVHSVDASLAQLKLVDDFLVEWPAVDKMLLEFDEWERQTADAQTAKRQRVTPRARRKPKQQKKVCEENARAEHAETGPLIEEI